jgi:hypothetical protein
MPRIVSVFLFSTICVFFSASLLAEQNTFQDINRAELMGIWAEDCSDPEAFFTLINLTHVMTISALDNEVYHSELESSWLNDSDIQFDLTDSTLNWRIGNAENHDVFIDQRCDQLPPTLSLLHGEASRFFFATSDIARQCVLSREACADAMVTHFDMANTGGLNEADIARLLRIATYFGTLDTWDATATFEDLWIGQAIAMSVSPFIAGTLIRNFDYDGDQQLSLQEFAIDRELFDVGHLTPNTTHGSGERVRELLEQLEQLFLLFQ